MPEQCTVSPVFCSAARATTARLRIRLAAALAISIPLVLVIRPPWSWSRVAPRSDCPPATNGPTSIALVIHPAEMPSTVRTFRRSQGRSYSTLPAVRNAVGHRASDEARQAETDPDHQPDRADGDRADDGVAHARRITRRERPTGDGFPSRSV